MQMKLSEWAEREYTDASRPSPKILRDMASNGDIQGAYQTRTRRWFVKLDKTNFTQDELLRRAIGDDPEMLKAVGL